MTIESSRQVLNRQTDINLPRAPVRAKKTMNIALLYLFGPKRYTYESQIILNRHDTEICHFPSSNPVYFLGMRLLQPTVTGFNALRENMICIQ